MRRFTPRLFIALFAAPLMLASSAALADGGAQACGNIELVGSGDCQYVVSGGCETQCTPPNLVAACDGQCNVGADVSCTGGCEASCEASCDPGSIDCQGSCTSECDAGCMSACSDAGCESDCKLDCDNRCQVSCNVTPPSCQASCQESCNASCTVQANIDCHVKCSVDLEGGCQTQCQTPQGALFCNGQYVDVVNDTAACEQYLAEHGLQVTTSTTCNASGCTTSIGCSAAPTVGAVDDRLGAGAIAGMMMAVGLVVSRRRRRA